MIDSLSEGAFYAVREPEGIITILKVLKIEPDGVHIRQYSNEFADLPARVDESALYMAGIHREPGERIGIGHTPVRLTNILNWDLTFVQGGTVTDEELDGYHYWKEVGGGWF